MAETVGSLIDKISILELKSYYMQKQSERQDAPPEHREACLSRLGVLKEQRDDLLLELDELMGAVLSGRKVLKVYRQFKMYNDPAYRTSASS